MRPLRGSLDAPRVATSWETADIVPLFSALIANMAALVEDHGAQFLVTLLYPEEWLTEELPEREGRARQALISSPMEVLDLRTTLAQGGPDLFLPDGHLTPQGHSLVAEALRSRLLELVWVR